MYNYKLGYHIKTGQLCRIPFDRIPVGTVRIINFRDRKGAYINYPHMKDGELDNRYWGIYRWQDLERKNDNGNRNSERSN